MAKATHKNIKKAIVNTVEKIWLNTDEAVAYLGVSRDFLDNLRKNNEITYYQYNTRPIWFAKSDLDRFVTDNKFGRH
jgi:excisionase family DNA binding protein